MTRSTRIWTARRAPGGDIHRGLLDIGVAVLPCVFGRSGITVRKREGDGATPAGTLAVSGGYFRRDRCGPGPQLRELAPIRADDGWCDDPAHGAYNRPVRLPFAAGHEVMRRADRLYDVCLVLDWNLARRARNRGSAIFLHLAAADGRPTQGCIAVAPAVMRRLLDRIRSDTAIRVLP